MKKYLESKQDYTHKLNIQMFAAEGEKSKLQKHLDELGENTSGGAHDAVTFSGKGLGILEKIFGPLRKKASKMDDEYEDEDDDEDEDDKPAPRKTKKNASKANGGAVEEEDEDPDDPANEENSIIANKGDRKSKDALKGAVSKSQRFDELRFEKNVEEEFDDVLDATPALAELAKSMKLLGKSMNGTNEAIAETQETVMVLAKAMREVLKSNAALAADIELIKKQPATSPATGFVVLGKGESGSGRRLSKSDIQDALTDLVNEDKIESSWLTRLGGVRGDRELQSFVDNLPAVARESL